MATEELWVFADIPKSGGAGTSYALLADMSTAVWNVCSDLFSNFEAYFTI